MNQYDANIVEEAEKFTNLSINNKDEIIQLLNSCNAEKNFNLFEQLCFTGKYVNGLLRVLKAGNLNPEVKSLDHIKKDLSENIEKVISQLKEITLNTSPDIQKYFTDKYFALNPETLKNLTELVSDLDIIKKYLNHIKRETSS